MQPIIHELEKCHSRLNFEIMLKILPIAGIGLSCVALEMSRTFLIGIE
jgi:hypothetical protein